MAFKDRLKEARIAKNFKQNELSLKLGLSKNAVSNYENGSSKPNIEVLYKLFNILEVEPNYLFQDEIDTTNIILAKDEQQLIENYRQLNSQGQEYIRQTMFMAKETYKKDITVSCVEIS